jgi:subtilisin family serine protease
MGDRRLIRALAAVLVLALGVLGSAGAAIGADRGRPGPSDDGAAYAPGRALVGAVPGRAGTAAQEIQRQGGRVVRFNETAGFFVVELPEQARPPQWALGMRNRPGVRFAEPDYVVTAEHHVLPDDPRWSDLWGLAKIDTPTAWHRTTGSSEVVVGIVDSGIDYNHPDLAGRLWQNPNETSNGIDDDGNGWVDDVHGIDCRNQDGDPMEDYWHGTHVAGTVGAAGNNGLGVVGVTWDVRLMPLKFLDSTGNGLISDAVTCIDYSIAAGVKVTNHSWGITSYSQALDEAVGRARDAGQLVVAAAGNDGAETSRYPARLAHDNVISVGATRSDDTWAGWSNYGPTVHLTAPGVGILSTYWTQFGDYISTHGTSMAAPHVTGVAALLLSLDPTLSPQALRQHIFDGVDIVPDVVGWAATDGRLNAAGAIESLLDSWVPSAPSGLVAELDDGAAVLDWDDSSEPHLAGYHVYRSTDLDAPVPWTRQTASPVSQSSFVDGGLQPGGSYHYYVTALDDRGREGPASATASVAVVDSTPPPGVPSGLVAADVGTGGAVAVAWDPVVGAAGYLLHRGTAAAGPYSVVTGSALSSTEFTDTGLVDGITYYYRVSAVDGEGRESELSAAVSVTPTDVTPPEAPTGLAAVVEDGAVVLSWNANTDPDLGGMC